MDDRFDIGYIIVVGLFLLGMATLYLWSWRGHFITGKLRGTRLEEHRRQWSRSMKFQLPIMGMLALSAADRFLDLCDVSRVRHAFWSGAIIASNFWLIGIMVSNLAPLLRQFHADREGQRNSDMGQPPAEPFSR